MSKEYIKDFYGRVMGTIEDEGTKQVARDFYGRVVGSYTPSDNKTRDFYGRVVMSGNGLIGLIMKESK